MSALSDLISEPPPERDVELEDLRSTAARLARQLATEKARTDALVAAVYRAAKDARIVVGPVKTKPAKDARKKGEEVAVLHATDWQAGKRTDTFDLDVLQERIALLAHKTLRITEVQRADHPVKRCVLMPGGDMVEGINIFPGQAYELDATLYEQLFRAANILEGLVRSLLQGFDLVEVWDMFGNHGRIGRKGESPRMDNVDRILYAIVAERFRGEPRVEWHHSETWHQHVPIGNYTALLIHGDQVKSFGGNLPAYGILRKVNAWAAGVLPPFSGVWIGHFHTPQILNAADGRKVYMTGSPESGNEFAREFVAATGPPSQTLAFVDPEAGRVTAYYDLELDR